MRIVRTAASDGHADVTESRRMLAAIAAGDEPETLRLYRPPDYVAFGRIDVRDPRYPDAAAAAEWHRFAAVERLAGGRAAVFHAGTVAFAWQRAEADPRAAIRDRFEAMAGVVREALWSLGVDARVGEVPGEYCPGAWSVNARGAVKLMGVGQRLVRGAAHTGGVVVVDGADRIRGVLLDVYRALDMDWEPTTVGAVSEEAPVSWDDVADAIAVAAATRLGGASAAPGSTG